MQPTQIKEVPYPGSKHPRLLTIWYYLTCWRPVSKHEVSKLAQSMLALYNTEVRARVKQDNEIITYLQGVKMAESMREEKGDDMYA